jgi:hypothetical protein
MSSISYGAFTAPGSGQVVANRFTERRRARFRPIVGYKAFPKTTA